MCAGFEFAQHVIDIAQSRTRHDPLGRHPEIASAQRCDHAVLQRIERRKIDMAAFGFANGVAVCMAEHLRHTKAGARTDDAGHPGLGKGHVRPAQVEQVFRADMRHGMAHSAKVVDQSPGIDTERFGNLGWPDRPRVVGQFQGFAVNGSGEADRDRAGQGLRERRSECRPGPLQAGIIAGLKRQRFAQVDDSACADRCERKAHMGSADVYRDDLGHGCGVRTGMRMARHQNWIEPLRPMITTLVTCE